MAVEKVNMQEIEATRERIKETFGHEGRLVKITIETLDQELLENGANPVEVLNCDGYLLIGTIRSGDGETKSIVMAQGQQSPGGIAHALDRVERVGISVLDAIHQFFDKNHPRLASAMRGAALESLFSRLGGSHENKAD